MAEWDNPDIKLVYNSYSYHQENQFEPPNYFVYIFNLV